MIEPPIDERYELAAVKDSLTADERKAAEHAYTVSAFDYEKAPVGSRDWTLFWSGWQKCAAQKAQPPCGADGAAEQGDIPDSVLLKAYTTASAGEILSHSWRPIFLRYARIGIAAAMRAMEAAPVAPATVAVPDGWRVKDDGHCVSVCWDGACYTLDDRQGSVYEAFCGFVRDVVKRAVTQPQAAQAVADAARTITVESELVEGGLYVIRALPHVDDPEFAKGKLQYFTRNPDHLGRLRLWKHFSGNYEALAVTLPEFPAMLAASQRAGGGT